MFVALPLVSGLLAPLKIRRIYPAHGDLGLLAGLDPNRLPPV
jgi:hypothetical protein